MMIPKIPLMKRVRRVRLNSSCEDTHNSRFTKTSPRTNTVAYVMASVVASMALSANAFASTNLVKNSNFYDTKDWNTSDVTARKYETNCGSNLDSPSNRCPAQLKQTIVCLSETAGVEPFKEWSNYGKSFIWQAMPTDLKENTRYEVSYTAFQRVDNASDMVGRKLNLLTSVNVFGDKENLTDWERAWGLLGTWVAEPDYVVFNNSSSNVVTSRLGVSKEASNKALATKFRHEFYTSQNLVPAAKSAALMFGLNAGQNSGKEVCITDVQVNEIQDIDVDAAKMVVNANGYNVNASKVATVGNATSGTDRWELRYINGGQSHLVASNSITDTPTLDQNSGENVVTVDFSAHTATGNGGSFRLQAYNDSQSGGACEIGVLDGSRCKVTRKPNWHTKFFEEGGYIKYRPNFREPCKAGFGSFDGANCFVYNPNGRNIRINGTELLYRKPILGSGCFDGHSTVRIGLLRYCKVGDAPAGSNGFQWAGNIYYTSMGSRDYCPVSGSWYDGQSCIVAKLPADASLDVDGYDVYVNTTSGLLAQSELFQIESANHLYSQMAYDSLDSFRHQRSNEEIRRNDLSDQDWLETVSRRERDAGTTSDFTVGVTCFAGDDNFGNVFNGCSIPGNNGKLTIKNGWYDAADHGKYVVNGGVSLWTLQYLLERELNKNSNFHTTAYGIKLIDEIKFELDFMMSMQAPVGTMAHVPVGDQNGVASWPANAQTDADGWYSNPPTSGVYQVKYVDDNGEAGKKYADNSVVAPTVHPFNGGRLPRLEISLTNSTVNVEGMAFHAIHDKSWTTLPTNPAHYGYTNVGHTGERVLMYPTTAATLNLAAVTAQCSRIFARLGDSTLASNCSTASTRAWTAAQNNPEVFRYEYADASALYWSQTDRLPGQSWGPNKLLLQYGFSIAPQFIGGGAYGDRFVGDEFQWAAVEREAAGFGSWSGIDTDYDFYDAQYRDTFVDGFDWQNTDGLANLAGALAGNLEAKKSLRAEASTLLGTNKAGRNSGISYGSLTNKFSAGVNSQYKWGGNGGMLNRAIIIASALDYLGEIGLPQSAEDNFRETFSNALNKQMNYFLGNNPLQRSYISGYGKGHVANPHHRYFAQQVTFFPDCSSSQTPGVDNCNNRWDFYQPEYPSIPAGFIVAGPNTGTLGAIVANSNRDLNTSSPTFGELTASSDKGAYYYINEVLASCYDDSVTGDFRAERCHKDHYKDFASNEIAINWQAPLVWFSRYLSTQ